MQYKLLSKSHLPFSAPDVRKVAEPREALELMLQEVQGLTSSAASGISEEHPSFRAMMRAYEAAERRGGDPEGMLADCEIRTRQNGASCSRKVGKVSFAQCTEADIRRYRNACSTLCVARMRLR